MRSRKVPRRLWDFGLKHSSKIMQHIPRDQLKGRTPLESVTGKMPDISEYCDFDFYDLVWYFPDVHPSISQENRALGRWLGVSHRIGSDMCYWILTKNGNVVADTTVQHVIRDEQLDPDIKQDIDAFNLAVNERLSDHNFMIPNVAPFALEDEDDFDKPLWDPAYGDNTPPRCRIR